MSIVAPICTRAAPCCTPNQRETPPYPSTTEITPPPLSPCCVVVGLQNGDECFCRNNKKYRRLGKIQNRNCKMECPGDSTETCGGASALEVFKIKNLKTDDADLEETSGFSADGTDVEETNVSSSSADGADSEEMDDSSSDDADSEETNDSSSADDADSEETDDTSSDDADSQETNDSAQG